MEGLPVSGQPRNYLRAGGLPDGIFEPLADVTERIRQGEPRRTAEIFGNPGYPAFSRGGVFVAPALSPRAADAGPGGTLSAGQTVTLGGPGNDGGIWRSKVFYLWQQHDADGQLLEEHRDAAGDPIYVGVINLSDHSFLGPSIFDARPQPRPSPCQRWRRRPRSGCPASA